MILLAYIIRWFRLFGCMLGLHHWSLSQGAMELWLRCSDCNTVKGVIPA